MGVVLAKAVNPFVLNCLTRKHANTQTRKYANTQTRKHANTQTRKHGEQTISSRLMDSAGCVRQEVWQFGVEGCGVGVLCLGVQIAFRGDVWRAGCHGGMPIVSHEASKMFERHS